MIDSVEDLDIVMPMHNLLEYSQNCSMTLRSLWNYYRDKIINDNASVGKSCKYNTKIVRKTPERLAWSGNPGDANEPPQQAVPTLSKYLSNFRGFINLALIICETELDLTWKIDYILIEHHDNITGVKFNISSTKLYVPAVTLLINNNIKFSKNIKQGFKGTISWNKYRSEVTTQTKNNNLDYLIDSTFRSTNRLFGLSFKNVNPIRDSVDKYYMPLVEAKDCNALIDNKTFLTTQYKPKKKRMKNLSQEVIIIQQKIYYIFHIIKIIINSLV